MADKKCAKRPEDWEQELIDLLQCLKIFGLRDINNIAKITKSQTPEEVKQAINHYKETFAERAPDLVPKKCKMSAMMNYNYHRSRSWDQLLMLLLNSFDYNEFYTESAESIRWKAECEDVPAKDTNIDFRKVYQAVADAMEGQPLPDDPVVLYMLKFFMIWAVRINKKLYPNFFEQLAMSVTLERLSPQPTDTLQLASLKYMTTSSSEEDSDDESGLLDSD